MIRLLHAHCSRLFLSLHLLAPSRIPFVCPSFDLLPWPVRPIAVVDRALVLLLDSYRRGGGALGPR